MKVIGDDHEKMLNLSHKHVTVKVEAEKMCNESPGECDIKQRMYDTSFNDDTTDVKVEEDIGVLVVQDDRQEEVIPSVIKDGHYVRLEVAYVEGP